MKKLGGAVIKSRGSFLSAFFLAGLIATIWVEAHADIDLIDTRVVTNASQLAGVAFSGWCSVYLPETAWEWQAYPTDGGQPWWVDCSQWPCLDLSPASTNVNGVAFFTVRLTKNVLTGETIFQSESSTNVLARVDAPSGYQPGARVEDRGVWWMWQQATNCPDCWGIEGEIPPPTVSLRIFVADVQNKPTWDAAVAAQEAAWEEMQTRIAESEMIAALEDVGDADVMPDISPCVITNETAPFAVVGIAPDSGKMTIRFESCSDHAYLVASTDELSTNTVWTYRAAIVPGQDGTTTWTDTSTTDTNVTSRFYRVQRMWLGDSVRDGIPDWWRQFYFGQATSTNGNNSCADCDPDGDAYSNYEEYLNGTDPNTTDAIPLILVNNDNPYSGSLTVSIEPSNTNYPNLLVSSDPLMTNATILPYLGSPVEYTLPDNGDGVYYLYMQYADDQAKPRSPVVTKIITVDRTPPVVYFCAPAITAVIDQAFIYLNAVAYDPDPMFANDARPLQVWINDQPFWGRAGTNIVVERFPVPATNSFTVHIVVADQAGNTNQATRTWTVDASTDVTAPQMSSFSIPTNSLLPDTSETWIEATVNDNNAIVDAIVVSETGDASTNALKIQGNHLEGLVPLELGTNLVIVRAGDLAGNMVSNSFTIIRSTHFRAAITNPVFGAFVTAPSNFVSGYVSAKFDEGLPTEKNITSVTINGVAATLGNADAAGNRPFTSAQRITVGVPIIGTIGGSGIPTDPAPNIPSAQSYQYEVLQRESHNDSMGGTDAAIHPSLNYSDCSLHCANWDEHMAWTKRDKAFNAVTSSAQCWYTSWIKNNVCVSDPHPEHLAWQFWSSGPDNPCPLDLSKALAIGTFASDGSGRFPANCWYYKWYYEGLQMNRERDNAALTFRAPRAYDTNTAVLLTFEGVTHFQIMPNTPPVDLGQVKFWGQPPCTWSNETETVSYLLPVDGGAAYTINQDSFDWPSIGFSTVLDNNGVQFPSAVADHSLTWTNFHNGLPVHIKWVDRDGIIHLLETSSGDVMVGEKVELTAEHEPGITVTPVKWDIGGQAVKNYTQTLQNGVITTHSTSDLQSTNVVFYWIANGIPAVSYTFMLNGQQQTVRTHFNVYKPSASLTSTLTSENPPVGIRPYPNGGTLTMLFGSGASPGITFTASVGKPAIGGGAIQLVQRCKDADTRNVILSFGGPAVQQRTTGGAFQLDSTSSFNIDQFGVVQLNPNAAQTALLPARFDYPAISLVDSLVSTWFSVAANQQFDDYLMFQPDTPDSIWITLRKITWQWNASGTNASPWTISIQNDGSTPSVLSSDLPVWDSLVQDTTWQ